LFVSEREEKNCSSESNKPRRGHRENGLWPWSTSSRKGKSLTREKGGQSRNSLGKVVLIPGRTGFGLELGEKKRQPTRARPVRSPKAKGFFGLGKWLERVLRKKGYLHGRRRKSACVSIQDQSFTGRTNSRNQKTLKKVLNRKVNGHVKKKVFLGFCCVGSINRMMLWGRVQKPPKGKV